MAIRPMLHFAARHPIAIAVFGLLGLLWYNSVSCSQTFLLSRYGVAVGDWRQRLVVARRVPPGGDWHLPPGIPNHVFFNGKLVYYSLNPDETFSDWDADFGYYFRIPNLIFRRQFLGAIIVDYYDDRTEITAVAVPFWFIALGVSLFFVRPGIRKLRGHYWKASGRCPVCGYDLRGSAAQCPECGTAPNT